MAKSITWAESNWTRFHLKVKLKRKCSKKGEVKDTGSEDAVVKAWQSIAREEPQRLVMSIDSRL